MRSLLPILLVAPLSVQAADASKPVPTIAGELTILHSEPIQINAEDDVCAVKIGGKVVYIQKCDAEYDPAIIANIKRKSSDGDDRQIIVIQRNPAGTACNGGPIFVLELSSKYDAMVSPILDFCGGDKPVIAQNTKGLLITFPGGPVNYGTGRVPAERWQYQGGAFMKVR
jgi:hypothetical protein